MGDNEFFVDDDNSSDLGDDILVDGEEEIEEGDVSESSEVEEPEDDAALLQTSEASTIVSSFDDSGILTQLDNIHFDLTFIIYLFLLFISIYVCRAFRKMLFGIGG